MDELINQDNFIFISGKPINVGKKISKHLKGKIRIITNISRMNKLNAISYLRSISNKDLSLKECVEAYEIVIDNYQEEPVFNYQCYICPICYDDHSREKTKECVERLKKRLRDADHLLKSIQNEHEYDFVAINEYFKKHGGGCDSK